VINIDYGAIGFLCDNWNDFPMENFIIYGYVGTAAETYAKSINFTFIPLDEVYINFDENAFPDGTPELVSEQVTAGEAETAQLAVADVTGYVLYDITLQLDGVAVQPESPVTVSIKVPDDLNGEKCSVFRLETDGSLTDMQATYQDGYMVFTTDHFSLYAVAELEKEQETTEESTESSIEKGTESSAESGTEASTESSMESSIEASTESSTEASTVSSTESSTETSTESSTEKGTGSTTETNTSSETTTASGQEPTTTEQGSKANDTGNQASWVLLFALMSVAGVGIAAMKKYGYRVR
jgi:hypothetical protein